MSTGNCTTQPASQPTKSLATPTKSATLPETPPATPPTTPAPATQPTTPPATQLPVRRALDFGPSAEEDRNRRLRQPEFDALSSGSYVADLRDFVIKYNLEELCPSLHHDARYGGVKARLYEEIKAAHLGRARPERSSSPLDRISPLLPVANLRAFALEFNLQSECPHLYSDARFSGVKLALYNELVAAYNRRHHAAPITPSIAPVPQAASQAPVQALPPAQTPAPDVARSARDRLSARLKSWDESVRKTKAAEASVVEIIGDAVNKGDRPTVLRILHEELSSTRVTQATSRNNPSVGTQHLHAIKNDEDGNDLTDADILRCLIGVHRSLMTVEHNPNDDHTRGTLVIADTKDRAKDLQKIKIDLEEADMIDVYSAKAASRLMNIIDDNTIVVGTLGDMDSAITNFAWSRVVVVNPLPDNNVLQTFKNAKIFWSTTSSATSAATTAATSSTAAATTAASTQATSSNTTATVPATPSLTLTPASRSATQATTIPFSPPPAYTSRAASPHPS